MTRQKRKRQFEKEIDQRYLVEKLLGEGGFCIVFKALKKENGERVAIKRMDKSKPLYRKFNNPKAMERLNALMYREADVMRSLDHANIMKLLDFIDDGVHIYLVMEFAEGGELWGRLLKSKRFTEATTVTIIKQVVDGVKFMHDSGYIHRDIKAENILFRDRKSLSIILTDFGLSKEADGLIFTNCGTLVYSAPELLLNRDSKKGYDKMVDNWAIGVLTYLLLSGHLPFDDVQQNDNRITNKILKAKVSFPYAEWGNANPHAKTFILKLLEFEALKRLELEEALRHTFLCNAKVINPGRTRRTFQSTPPKEYMIQNQPNLSEELSLFPMMEASHLQILARTRWKVVLYFSLTLMQLKSQLKTLV